MYKPRNLVDFVLGKVFSRAGSKKSSMDKVDSYSRLVSSVSPNRRLVTFSNYPRPMSKRVADDSEDRAAKLSSRPSDVKQAQNGVEAEDGMGEFEDQFGDDDDESAGEEEIIENDDDEDSESQHTFFKGQTRMADCRLDFVYSIVEVLGAPEDEDPQPEVVEKQPYIPGVSRPLTAEEILEPDYSVYLALHQLSYTWPCLSFDVLRDDLGWERNKFPHTSWVVAGTQAGQDGASSGGMGKAKDEVVVMKMGGLSRTRGDTSDDEEEEEDVDDYDEDAHLEFLSIPHTGGVNRIRAQKQLPSTGLPPAGTPYHVATMAETGKVHIFDVRPMIDQLASPSTALPRSDASKRPIHTITHHGRNEGFALDWSPASQSKTDLRLLTGDIASHIFATNLTESGFVTQNKPFLSHTSSIEDLQWSPSEPTVFASCSADRSVRVWDVRVKNRKSVTGITQAHDEDVNVISWNTGVEYLLCSGGDEGGIKVWDLRNLKGA